MVTGAVAAQVYAAEPAASSWVAANAGSGKTRVLTDRVARLLLAGTEPGRILCLTYTKAAAAEMQNRLFRTLGGWAMLPDAELHAALGTLGAPERVTEPHALAQARTLFARALETPGGLKIQTIHAFCESLLRRFPLEAGVAPQFAVLDDRQAQGLRDEVLDALAVRAPAVFVGMARHLTGDDPGALLQEINHHRAAFADVFDEGRLARALGVAPGDTVQALATRVLDAEAAALIERCLPALEAGKTTDTAAAGALREVLALEAPEARLEALEAALLTAAGTPISKLPTKGVATAHPELATELRALKSAVEAARQQRLGIAALGRSRALHAFARAYLDAFAARKRALGLLDFDDLIDGATALLTRPETAAWVLWRLDGGLDHILVDEAQDTSPAQWRVIEAISAEFFAGQGARELIRTIFVVGDEKQSIYSFQGADPAAFGAMRGHFDRMLTDMGDALRRCDLLYSFRSSVPILRLVDAVFAGEAGGEFAGPVAHHPTDPARPGRVEVWPAPPTAEKPQAPPWDAPQVPAAAPADTAALVAGRVVERIAEWLAEGRALPGSERAIRPGDVLILVQRRGPMFHAVLAALKRASVPVAGADQLELGEELAVRDLLAALRFAATPQDDLSLAALLRSPLGGVSEADLFALAHRREGTLWEALRTEPPERRPALRAMLEDLLAVADYLRPFEMLSRLLVRHDGRRRLVARLGAQAEDAIDALLDQALAYEAAEAPSLTGFLGWMDRASTKIKRELGRDHGEVRVMTVHGAKGLEAPIVILPDTATRPEGANPPQLLRLEDGQAVWKTRAEEAPPSQAEAEAARQARVAAENRRLLYVALTRAQSWLVVCGDGTGWHALIEAACAGLAPERLGGVDGETLVLSHAWSENFAPAPEVRVPPAAPPLRALPAPAAVARVLSPSALGGGHALGEEAADPALAAAARDRGTALHALLEALPLVPPEQRGDLARRLLPVAEDLAALLAEAEAVLALPEARAFFATDALAEVEVAAALMALGGARVAGRIDRLLVSPDRVLAVDFKTNRLLPETPEAVPEGILRQMGAYAAALAQVWHGRRIETAVLWTRAPLLMPLPAALTAAALARVDPALWRS